METNPFEGKLWLVIIITLALIIFFCTLKALVGEDFIEEIADEIKPEEKTAETSVAPSAAKKPDAPKPLPLAALKATTTPIAPAPIEASGEGDV